jgi:hypothetical protein
MARLDAERQPGEEQAFAAGAFEVDGFEHLAWKVVVRQAVGGQPACRSARKGSRAAEEPKKEPRIGLPRLRCLAGE